MCAQAGPGIALVTRASPAGNQCAEAQAQAWFSSLTASQCCLPFVLPCGFRDGGSRRREVLGVCCVQTPQSMGKLRPREGLGNSSKRGFRVCPGTHTCQSGLLVTFLLSSPSLDRRGNRPQVRGISQVTHGVGVELGLASFRTVVSILQMVPEGGAFWPSPRVTQEGKQGLFRLSRPPTLPRRTPLAHLAPGPGPLLAPGSARTSPADAGGAAGGWSCCPMHGGCAAGWRGPHFGGPACSSAAPSGLGGWPAPSAAVSPGPAAASPERCGVGHTGVTLPSPAGMPAHSIRDLGVALWRLRERSIWLDSQPGSAHCRHGGRRGGPGVT